MALFKKKKDEPVNPYYNESNLKPISQPSPADNNTNASMQVQQQPAPAQEKKQTGFSIPLIPVPNVKIPDINLQPLRTGGISVLDALRLESNSKSVAFIKMSDFKKVLDDIKDLEKRITQSQMDLENYSRVLNTQKDYIKNYNLLVQDMRKMIERMSAYLSNVEE